MSMSLGDMGGKCGWRAGGSSGRLAGTPRPHPAAHAIGCLQQQHWHTRFVQLGGSMQARDAGAHHHHLWLLRCRAGGYSARGSCSCTHLRDRGRRQAYADERAAAVGASSTGSRRLHFRRRQSPPAFPPRSTPVC